MSDHKTNREEMAKEYDAIHNRLFLLQILVLGTLLGVYQFSGASAALARGLAGRFGNDLWYVTNAVYTMVTVFGFAAFMSPFSYYSNHVLERHYGLSSETVFDWLSDFIKSLLIDLLLATVLFSVVYAFLRWIPDLWWLSAAAFYILFAVIISTVVPIAIMPLFHKFELLEEGELTTAIQKMLEEADIKVIEVCKWGGEGKVAAANVAFAGYGHTKRIVLSEGLLTDYTQEEILAIVAQEIGHYKNHDMLRLMVTSSLLALLGFFIAHHCLIWLTAFFGIPSIYDIGAAPIFIFSLLVFSLVSMPFANLHSRRREFAADAYAIEKMGSPDALVSAFEKQADQNLSHKEPSVWVEFLLHSHPSMARRIDRARNS
jgi:STE24 endopeptidase